ncbi:hypothetical protein [Vibrio sp. Hal054]|uniref:hypothetical protein n=1 Tax=Vibrio sp. Hal054 TaxID=3035158 RepID=UPI00301BDF6D
MDLHKLAKMSESEIAEWVRSNTDKFTLLPDSELETIIIARDRWEERATELASDVGTLLNIEVGEHSNANCPVQNALDAVYQATQANLRHKALKERLGNVLDGNKLN